MESARQGEEALLDDLRSMTDKAGVRHSDDVVTVFTEARRAYALESRLSGHTLLECGAAVFDMIDVDGDGRLSARELAAYLGAFRRPHPHACVVRVGQELRKRVAAARQRSAARAGAPFLLVHRRAPALPSAREWCALLV
eukprot:gene45223-22140_t